MFPDLERLVRPRSIAVVGATNAAGSPWHRGVDNLVAHSRFAGALHLVNPACADAFGHPCHPSLADVPGDEIDIVCMLVGPEDTLASLADAGCKRIGHVIVWTPGFAEMGADGIALEERLRDLAQACGARLYGPNSPGVTNLIDAMTLTPSGVHRLTLRSGPVGVASQGGGLGRNVMHNLHARTGVGLWLSAGNEADLGIADFIAHMAREPEIRVIAAIVEGVGDGRRFTAALDLARDAGKPVVVLKIGKSASGEIAVRSHTASLAGSAAVLSTALAQHGAIEVDDTDELADTAGILTRIHAWRGPRVCVLSFSGGSNGLCCDHIARNGLAMSKFSAATVDALDRSLSRFATRHNPLDIGAEVLADPSSATKLFDFVLADDDVDIVLTPIPMEHEGVTAALAHILADAQARTDKLIVPVWNTGLLGEGYHILCERGMTPFLTIGAATRALARIDRAMRARSPADAIEAAATVPPLPPGRFSEAQAKRLLAERGIPVPPGRLAVDTAEAIAHAQAIGFPVVAKASGAAILHKSDHGLVEVGLADADAVRSGCERIRERAEAAGLPMDGILVEAMAAPGLEMIVGVHQDASFGPVLTVGLGGTGVELRPDIARRLLPVGREEVERMLAELASAPLLSGYRGSPPRDTPALVDLVARVASIASAQPGVELELNPVRVGKAGDGVVALDAVLSVGA